MGVEDEALVVRVGNRTFITDSRRGSGMDLRTSSYRIQVWEWRLDPKHSTSRDILKGLSHASQHPADPRHQQVLLHRHPHQCMLVVTNRNPSPYSLLSKPWLNAAPTNPNLCFDESDFEARRRNGWFLDFHDKFSSIVDNALERYRRRDLPISALSFASFSNQTDSDGLIDKWLDIVAEKRASQVALLVKNRSGYYSESYSLLADTIFAIESLQRLELITIQTISFQYCIRLRCIRVTKNLPNLLSLSIFSCPIEVNMVGAPKNANLRYLDKLEPYSSIGKRLRMLNLVKKAIDDTVLFQLIQKLDSVKELILHSSDSLSEISSELNDQVVDLTLPRICQGLRPATGIDHLPTQVRI
ncbi:hypothetical protein HAX54_002469 [Datura stramonium]|uniref:Uncharacterized protein n=1 Tax=Datura stramonium TaxID=4076 RepID=A0ABS8RT57_DATST|nr:hypothetical protein [Datura stramonium]